LTKDIINSIELFKDLNDEQIKKLISISKIKNYPKNGIVHYEGDKLKSLQFLISGVIKIYKLDKYNNEIFLYYLYKGNMISEFSSCEYDNTYSFSNAQLNDDGEVLCIDFNEFKVNYLDTGVLTSNFLKVIFNKTHQLHELLNRELVFDARSKVAHMLQNDLKMFNKLKRSEVAFILHIQPETLSRVLKKLIKLSIIKISNYNINIINSERLVKVFNKIGN